MTTMKSTNNKLAAWGRSRSQMAMDMEIVAQNKRTEYHNTAVSAYNAEIHALHGKMEYLTDVVHAQSQAIVDLMKENNELKQLMMKAIRTQGKPSPVDVEETTTGLAVTYHHTEEEAEDVLITLQRQYRRGVNIMWKQDLPAVDIAFNEFDIFRRDKGMTGMVLPEHVHANWITLKLHCRALTGMTLGRLLKEYDNQLGLNY